MSAYNNNEQNKDNTYRHHKRNNYYGFIYKLGLLIAALWSTAIESRKDHNNNWHSYNHDKLLQVK